VRLLFLENEVGSHITQMGKHPQQMGQLSTHCVLQFLLLVPWAAPSPSSTARLSWKGPHSPIPAMGQVPPQLRLPRAPSMASGTSRDGAPTALWEKGLNYI